MPNRLAQETSPYLLQHQHNPVDWRPWGDDAFAAARERGVPVLVSIGYSACHWCHVMERESFEDADVAALMNERFVCIKVDREERPDVDAVYMEAVQAMTGRGGWPLNAFTTPDGVPFYAGTYFPPQTGRGMPSWRQVLEAISGEWTNRRTEIEQGAQRIRDRLAGAARLAASEGEPEQSALDAAVAHLRSAYDGAFGGWGGAPKFPQAGVIEFLLRRGETEMSLETLRQMAARGMYDQIGGGFARYSVDERWLVPHFEKMLYDNALLARAYLHGWQLSGEQRLRGVCTGTLDFALRELRQEEGGFASAYDADSEGAEGRFYVWTVEQVSAALADDPRLVETAIAAYGLTGRGNFEGANIPVMAWDAAEPPPALERVRARLYEARAQRVWPGLDDKRVCSWNALMLAALADAGAALERTDYLDAARACASFLLDAMRAPDGTLYRTYNRGQAKIPAFLEDHAFLMEALIVLYEATFEPRWLSEARALAAILLERFADPEHGGFFSTPADHDRNVIARRKELEDMPIPSGASSACYGLLRLARLTGESAYEQAALGVIRLLHRIAPQHPTAFGHLLCAIDFHLAPVREVALAGAGEELDALARTVRARFRPHIVLAGGAPDGIPLLEGRTPVDGHAAAYVCEHFACRRPVTEPRELAALLE